MHGGSTRGGGAGGGAAPKSMIPQPLVVAGSVYPVLLQGIIMVERFIIHVCLYGDLGMPLLPSGHVCGQSVHGAGGGAGAAAVAHASRACWCGAALARASAPHIPRARHIAI
jgi:hypothetical protein